MTALCDVVCALAKSFPDCLSPSLQHMFEAASELGVSGWLTTLPSLIMDLPCPRVSLGMLFVYALVGRFLTCLRLAWTKGRFTSNGRKQ